MAVLLYCLFIVFFSSSYIYPIHDTVLDQEDEKPLLLQQDAYDILRNRLKVEFDKDARVYATWTTGKGRMWVMEITNEENEKSNEKEKC
jgi:6-phosphogluconate dehydrogenase